MSNERYVGERRALWHFLAELSPLIVVALGEKALLKHQIDRALKTGDLTMLREARRIFHTYPEPFKRQLMRGIFEEAASGDELPSSVSDDMMPPLESPLDEPPASGPEPAHVVVFEAFPAARQQEVALAVEPATGDTGGAPIRVMIKPGTLPRGAAEALRQVADWIENDRRMLSSQHWAERDRHVQSADETVDLL